MVLFYYKLYMSPAVLGTNDKRIILPFSAQQLTFPYALLCFLTSCQNAANPLDDKNHFAIISSKYVHIKSNCAQNIQSSSTQSKFQI